MRNPNPTGLINPTSGTTHVKPIRLYDVFEMLAMFHEGASRAITALRDGRDLEAGRYDWGIEHHGRGRVGEHAVAEYLGLYTDINVFGIGNTKEEAFNLFERAIRPP